MVRDLLESSGHEIGLAADGPSALASVRTRVPDLLILDLNMPGLSGYDVCRAVKRNPGTSRVPVLMLTAQSSVEHKLEGFEAGADDYLPKPFDGRELRARVSALLRLVRREADRNPTSGLPGGHAIDEELLSRIARKETFAVCYIDLDNFKPFADHFGFAVADDVIRETGDAIRHAVSAVGSSDDFVGHIGGDDFVVITTPDRAEAISVHAIASFDLLAPLFYDAATRERGYIDAHDRQGRPMRFPFVSLSIGIVSTALHPIAHVAEVAQRSIDPKKRAKELPGSTYVFED